MSRPRFSMNANEPAPKINPLLLELLRCPLARRENPGSDDPGRLRLINDSWLVCDESGMKYPIKNGIPIMLITEGAKWRNTDVSDLPIPPPAI